MGSAFSLDAFVIESAQQAIHRIRRIDAGDKDFVIVDAVHQSVLGRDAGGKVFGCGTQISHFFIAACPQYRGFGDRKLIARNRGASRREQFSCMLSGGQ
jgi:hypothetical protein